MRIRRRHLSAGDPLPPLPNRTLPSVRRHARSGIAAAALIAGSFAGNPGATVAGSEVSAARAKALPAISLSTTTSTGSRLLVDVDPDLSGGRSWRFILYRQNSGKWRKVGAYRTKGGQELRSLRVKPGTYRVRVLKRPGFGQVTSTRYTYPAAPPAVPTGPTRPAPGPSGGPSETPTSPTPSAPEPSPTRTPWWSPAPGTDWQWQLHGALDTTVSAPVFDIDGETNSVETVAALKAKGIHVICYFSAGSYERGRPDTAAFPEAAIGNQLVDWPNERWLDIRHPAILPIMEKRIADCAAKGFEAVEPDNIDGQANSSGFPLTVADQLSYDRALADLAHKYGLGVALKNYGTQVGALYPQFDFAVVEECVRVGDCSAYVPFILAGKAVLEVEYQGTLESICPVTKSYGFSAMLKTTALEAWRSVCP